MSEFFCSEWGELCLRGVFDGQDEEEKQEVCLSCWEKRLSQKGMVKGSGHNARPRGLEPNHSIVKIEESGTIRDDTNPGPFFYQSHLGQGAVSESATKALSSSSPKPLPPKSGGNKDKRISS